MKRLLGALLGLVLLATPAAAGHQGTDTSKLRKQVRLSKLFDHLEELQEIADENGGTRASGTPGYQASVRYVLRQLRRERLNVTLQNFEFPFFQELAPAQLARTAPTPQTFVNPTDFAVMTYSGSGNVTNNVQPVDTTATPVAPTDPEADSGCEADDFAGFVAGRIALLQRGECSFRVKALNAQAAGAGGAVIFARGVAGETNVILGTLGDTGVTIPVVGASFAVGQALYSTDSSVVARLFTSTISEIRTTTNVIAETRGGDPNKVVVVGAHLDTVPESPGVVDNGTGTATVLEIARNLDKVVNTRKTGGRNGLRNKVRFAWWGAEELGLRGARYYVSQLSPAEQAKITLNINMDMIASSNGVLFVTDGDGSTFGVRGAGRSAEAEQVFLDYFASQGLPTEPRALDGRSDWAAFNEVGIGFGNVSTGSDQVKTPEQVARFGGTAGIIMHPCYHAACDRIDTVNRTLFNATSDANAHATLWFAMDGQPIRGGDDDDDDDDD
jgi:Zn-dependent M28 family amino/carboxypeptidase